MQASLILPSLQLFEATDRLIRVAPWWPRFARSPWSALIGCQIAALGVICGSSQHALDLFALGTSPKMMTHRTHGFQNVLESKLGVRGAVFSGHVSPYCSGSIFTPLVNEVNEVKLQIQPQQTSMAASPADKGTKRSPNLSNLKKSPVSRLGGPKIAGSLLPGGENSRNFRSIGQA